MTDDQSSARVFPFRRACPFDLPIEYARLREDGEVPRIPLAAGGHAWLVTRYEDVKAALADDRLSNDRTQAGYPSPVPIPPAMRTNGSILGMDAPEHTVYRKMVKAEFTLQRVNSMAPRVQQLIDEHLDRFIAGGGPADLVSGFAKPLTLAVIGELLAIPTEDLDSLHKATQDMFNGARTKEERHAAITFLDTYFENFIAGKFRSPRNDMMSRVISKNPQLTQTEAVHLARLLLNGGHDSTASMISLGLLTLLQHPEQYKALSEDPSLAENVVEELLRYLTVTDLATARVAARELTIGDSTIPVGDGIYPSTASANRDPEMFEDPEAFRPSRPDVRKHVAFGFGRHLCLGADLARLELQHVFATIARRLPDLRLAVPAKDVQVLDGGFVYRLAALPLAW
ncbi:cytochrome P450 [Kitasatospora sp. NPDC058218]|uniref:cytochrome P450 n=1 Tax=Kitasatospora sp. NPDC058218 TaxID=3346385 RepID=UPI0036DB225E